MAIHYIYDAKGRLEKVLNDVEYAAHRKKQGCYGCLVLIVVVAFTVWLVVNSMSNDNKSKEGPAVSSQVKDNNTKASKIDRKDKIYQNTETITDESIENSLENDTENGNSEQVKVSDSVE